MCIDNSDSQTAWRSARLNISDVWQRIHKGVFLHGGFHEIFICSTFEKKIEFFDKM